MLLFSDTERLSYKENPRGNTWISMEGKRINFMRELGRRGMGTGRIRLENERTLGEMIETGRYFGVKYKPSAVETPKSPLKLP